MPSSMAIGAPSSVRACRKARPSSSLPSAPRFRRKRREAGIEDVAASRPDPSTTPASWQCSGRSGRHSPRFPRDRRGSRACRAFQAVRRLLRCRRLLLRQAAVMAFPVCDAGESKIEDCCWSAGRTPGHPGFLQAGGLRQMVEADRIAVATVADRVQDRPARARHRSARDRRAAWHTGSSAPSAA